MTNTMPGTSQVAPMGTSNPPVPSAMPPAAPVNASLPTVSLPTGPGEKPAGSQHTENEIKEVMEVTESGTPASPASSPSAVVPAPMAKPMTPPSLSVASISPTPVAPVPLVSIQPSAVVPPQPIKPVTASEPIKPVAPSTANLVSPIVGVVPTTTVVSSSGSDEAGGADKKKTGGSKMKFVAPLLVLFFLVIGGIVAFSLSQRAQNIQNQASALTAKGEVESQSCAQVTGWACDSADYSKPLKIALYYDEFKQDNLILVADANVNHADAATSCGGTTNHGFVIAIPDGKMPAGQHTLIVKGIPVGANGQLNSADMFSLAVSSQAGGLVSCGSTSQSCSVQFTAAAAPKSSIACSKDTYSDSLSNAAGQYAYTTKNSSFNPGDVVVFKITLKNTGEEVQQFSLADVLTGENLEQLDFMDTSCGSYSASTKTITASTNPVAGGDEVICGFRARVKSNLTQSLIITNTANITSGTLSASCNAPLNVVIPGSSPSPSPSPTPSVSPSPSPSPSPSVSPSPSPLVCGSTCTSASICPNDHSCNNGKCQLNTCIAGTSCSDDMCRATSCGSSCSTNTDCPNDHTCSAGVCKLTTCVNNTSSCTTDSCSVIPRVVNVVTQTPTVITPTVISQSGGVIPKPSPTVGCNVACESNADCSNSNHICVDTATGRRCRLDSNVASETCAAIGQTIVPTPKPVNLPVAGSNDIMKALAVGAVSVVLGIVGLLLL